MPSCPLYYKPSSYWDTSILGNPHFKCHLLGFPTGSQPIPRRDLDDWNDTGYVEYPLETMGNHRKMWGNSDIYNIYILYWLVVEP